MCKLAITSEDRNTRVELLERFEKECGGVHRIEMTSRFDLGAINQLVNIVKRDGIDVIHSHGYKSDVIALLLSWRTGVLAVSTPHGFGQVVDRKLRLYFRIGLLALRRFDAVVPLSDELEKQILHSGVSSRRVRLIPNGVDLSEIPDISNRLARSEGHRLGYVGRLARGKQVEHILDAFNRLWTKDKRHTLTIAGEGSERTQLQHYASNLESAPAISFLGFVADRFTLMQELDLFVMASEAEGIPRSLMEAHALRLPIVAYDIPGVNQLVRHKETGLLAPLGDWQALANCCHESLADRAASRTMAERGCELVEVNFSAARMATEYTKLYEELIGRE